MLESELKKQDLSVIDPPPFFDTWNKMYAMVMGRALLCTTLVVTTASLLAIAGLPRLEKPNTATQAMRVRTNC